MELHVTQLNVDNGVGLVRLNRPGRGNSWTTRMNAEYRWLMSCLDDDPRVRVIVVTGAGQQFCVGADTKALDHYRESDQNYLESFRNDVMATPGYGVRPEYEHELIWHWGLQKPVIAAINGACAGIAVALAAYCDLRYAAEGAKFTTSTPRLGLPAEFGLSWIMPRIVGLTHSADILLSGRVFLADEARAMGFLNGVMPREELEEEVLRIARGLAGSTSPVAVKTAKRQVYADLMRHDAGAAIEDSRELMGQLMKEPDFSEALRAMKDKRAPAFTPLPGTAMGSTGS
ncbi:enoyl-CoA hydratase/isomerase family protein (plasmid) [Cupriavidus sp. KK10]|uniref:enoyl-CoA hydratase-related protein n=1 Tax=Cupriavidus sp. KK10 TaxID=1478019 RepID=UPI001BA628A3|nr:enoyl-CoA hydratase-related protein [Cupriavidus sp. KK10]QUN32382.1 enoyl-CoA hydratase/isomerase family protein [Cupriavidus sp. KK10]